MRPCIVSLLAALALPAVLAPACTDRTEPSSAVGRRYAQQLCAVQTACDCDEAWLIPSCEARVESLFIEVEREALAAGLELDEDCFERTLDYVDGLPSCTPIPDPPIPACPVYTAYAEEGAPCETFSFVPWMTHCRAGLLCIHGTCENLLDPYLLFEGEICSDTQASRPTGDLGKCAEGLICDSEQTRTCVPDPYWPPVPTGGVCLRYDHCVPESYCRTEDPDGPSDESPGICTMRTPDGEACENLLDCSIRCTDGFCELPLPRLCDLLGEWWGQQER